MDREKNRSENDILTDEFYKRLKDNEFPVDETVWEKIESDLIPINKAGNSTKTGFRLSVAAVILIALSIGLERYLIDKKRDFPTEATNKVTNSTRVIVPEESNPVLYAENRTLSSSLSNSKSSKRKVISSTEKESKETIPDAISEVHDETQKDFSEPIQNFNSQPVSPEPELWENLKIRRKKQKVSFALSYGSSGNSSFSNSITEGSAKKQLSYSSEIRNEKDALYSLAIEMNSSYENHEVLEILDVRYDVPISVGLAVRKSLTDVWALESGLMYTYLGSTETLKYSTGYCVTQDVALHYLGVPLKIVYSFYSNKNLSLYAAGGGMAEKSLYGKSVNSLEGKSERVDIKEWQFSVSGGVGLTYQLIDHFHLFAEPAVGYYFDDGSAIKTIRDDKPLNFNLQLGLRLSY
jgi:hypothetical protein